jgi:DNA repair exonuclease SbcCD ATPase subunit
MVEERHISRSSLSEKRVSVPVQQPPVDLNEAQSRLAQLISNIAAATEVPLPKFSADTSLLEVVATLEHNLHLFTESHSLNIQNLQTSLSESQRMMDALKLRERDQSSAITDVTARNDDLDRRLRQTQKEFDRVQNELDAADDLVESLRQEVVKAKEEARIAEVAAQGREAESLKREKALRQSESEQFRAALATKEKLISEITREHETLREQLETYQQNTVSWRSEHDSKTREYESSISNLETQLVVLKSENATLKSKLDEALGSRQQRANEARLQRELEEQREKFLQTAQSQESLLAEVETLNRRNSQLVKDLQAAESKRSSNEDMLSRQILALEKQVEMNHMNFTTPVSSLATGGNEAGGSSRERELETRCEELQSELSSILDDFERLTSQFIDHESFRSTLETQIDGLRAQCHNLQTELAKERVRMLGRHGLAGGDASPLLGIEPTSTVTLRNEFRKMVAELRSEHIAALKV